MAVAAGLAGGLAVLLVAAQATDSFMDAPRRAVVARAGLCRGQRRVALVAKRLTLVGTGPNPALAFEYGRQEQRVQPHVHPGSAVE